MQIQADSKVTKTTHVGQMGQGLNDQPYQMNELHESREQIYKSQAASTQSHSVIPV